MQLMSMVETHSWINIDLRSIVILIDVLNHLQRVWERCERYSQSRMFRKIGQKMFARLKDNMAQIMDAKIIYHQRIQSYQVARSLLRQEATTFFILKLHCHRFYTSLHSTVISFNFHAQSQQPHKKYRNRGILRNIQKNMLQ